MTASKTLAQAVSPARTTAGQGQAVEQFSLARLLALHLAPGVIVTLAYILLTPPLLARGIPNLLTLNIVALLVLAPVEMGILFYEGKRCTGRYTLEGVVLYREALPWKQMAGYCFLAFVWVVLCFGLLQSRVDPWVQKTLFGWVPAWFPLSTDFSPFPKIMVVLTLVASLISTSWIAPFVEEYYFRGYLLPRMARFGSGAPVLNAVLFTLYHFFTPWQFVTRVAALIPMVWIVQRKRSLWISIIVHLLLNTISILPLLITTIAS